MSDYRQLTYITLLGIDLQLIFLWLTVN